MSSKVSIVKCENYDPEKLLSAIGESVDLIGGISKFIKPKDKVLIKPNLLAAVEPERGIDTHPEFIRAVIKLLKETNAELFIGDGPSVWGSPEDVDNVYEKTGVKKVAQEEKINLVKFDKSIIRQGYVFTDWIEKCNKIVSLPKFKTHDLTILTGAIKNLFGLIPGLSKTDLHRKGLRSKDFAPLLVDIYSLIKPTLSIVDGVLSLEGDGPASGGIARKLGLVLAGVDAVAIDSIIAAIMGIAPDDVLATREAAKRNLGISSINEIEVLGEKLKDVIVPDYKLPQNSVINKMPGPILGIVGHLIVFRPHVVENKCVRCGICKKACPVSAITVTKRCAKIDYKKCVLCMCCKELCPEGAVIIEKNTGAKILHPIFNLVRKIASLFSK